MTPDPNPNPSSKPTTTGKPPMSVPIDPADNAVARSASPTTNPGGPKVDVPVDFAGVHRPPAISPDGDAISQCPSCLPETFYESIYNCADGDASRVPWADCRPNPIFVEWMNREACHLVRPGSRAVVVGCGLGDDVTELVRRGYDATGFDVSITAVRWAARRHSSYSDRFMQADLLNLPGRLVGRFDLAVEIATVQSVHPSLRKLICAGIAKLIAPRGAVMVLARTRDDDDELDPHDGPPWPLTRGELLDLMRNAGLGPRGEIADVGCPSGAPSDTRWLLGTFVRC